MFHCKDAKPKKLTQYVTIESLILLDSSMMSCINAMCMHLLCVSIIQKKFQNRVGAVLESLVKWIEQRDSNNPDDRYTLFEYSGTQQARNIITDQRYYAYMERDLFNHDYYNSTTDFNYAFEHLLSLVKYNHSDKKDRRKVILFLTDGEDKAPDTNLVNSVMSYDYGSVIPHFPSFVLLLPSSIS